MTDLGLSAVLASVVGWASILPQENHPLREILGKSNFLQDFWISAIGEEIHFTATRVKLSIRVVYHPLREIGKS